MKSRRFFLVISLLTLIIFNQCEEADTNYGDKYHFNHIIKGMVIDAITKEPIDSANVNLYWNWSKGNDESLILSRNYLTDEEGFFVTEKLPTWESFSLNIPGSSYNNKVYDYWGYFIDEYYALYADTLYTNTNDTLFTYKFQNDTLFLVVALELSRISYSIIPDYLDFRSDRCKLPISILNSGSNSISYQIKRKDSWITYVMRESGWYSDTSFVNANGYVIYDISIDRSLLLPGIYSSSIEILINMEENTVIPVNMIVQ
jgi:hypothetical protein